MNDVLNRYYAEQLAYFSRVNLLKLYRAKHGHEPAETVRYAMEIYKGRTYFLKGLLAKQEAHVGEIHRGLITSLTAQHKALVEAGKTASKDVKGDADHYLNEILRFYWTAAACICSLGRELVVLPVDHLDKYTNIVARRMLAQVINRLKKQSFKTHLDVVNFMESYISIEHKGLINRWRWLLYRSLLPVRVR